MNNQLIAIVLLVVALIAILLILAFIFPNKKGRSGQQYAGLTLLTLFGGRFGIVSAIIMAMQHDRQRNQLNMISDQLRRGILRKCPYCAEIIKGEAKVCRYCGRDVSPTIQPTHSL